MKNSGLNPMNVENALEVLYGAIPSPNADVVASYWVVKEFIAIIKEEAGFDKIPAILKKKE